MARILISQEKDFPLDTEKIKLKLSDFLNEKGIDDELEISVAIVGESTMIELAQKYLNEENTLHNVLSFTTKETREDFINPPYHKDLGEIYICYPKIVEEAGEQKISPQKWATELAIHGALHLMGIHHE